MRRELKRVLWVLDYFPRPHDMTAGVWGLESAQALRRAGLDVAVLAPTPWIPRALAWSDWLRGWASVPPEARFDGLPVVYPKCPHYPHRLVMRYLYHRLPWLDGALVWRWCAPAVARLAREFRFDLVHANFIFPAGVIGREIKRAYGVPLIVHERSLSRLRAARAHAARGRIYAGVVRAADATITINRRMAGMIDALAGRSGGVDVVHAAGYVRPAEAISASRPDAYRSAKVVLCVGAFIERKGQEQLIRAAAQLRAELPELRCILIGDGVRRAPLEALAATLGLAGCVEFWGRRPHAEVLRTMSWCDIFALPSWDEPGGTVYGEAMGFGKPILACAGEGITEVARAGEHGLFVPARDPAALAAALRLLLTDAPLAARLGAAAGRLAAAELSYDGVAARLIEIYRRALAGAGSAA